MHKHKWALIQSKHDDDWDEGSWSDAAAEAGFDAEDPRACPTYQYRCSRCGLQILSDLDDPTREVRKQFRDCDMIIVQGIMKS